MYMAEALVALDRIADAISHLNPESLTPADVSTVPPEAKADPGVLCDASSLALSWLILLSVLISSKCSESGRIIQGGGL